MYDKNIIIIITKAHLSMLFNIGIVDVYLSIIAIILSGIYLLIKAATSGRPMLFFTNVSILKKISTIAIKNTNDENLLKNIITIKIKTTKTIKSIYILPTPYYSITSLYDVLFLFILIVLQSDDMVP